MRVPDQLSIRRLIRTHGRMFTFRTSITFAVMAFVGALAALLILIQFKTFRLATEKAASAYMDAASSRAFGRLQTQVAEIASLVRVLSTSSTWPTSEKDGGRPRNCAVHGCATPATASGQYLCCLQRRFLLQVRRLDGLSEQQRETLRAPAGCRHRHQFDPAYIGRRYCQ